KGAGFIPRSVAIADKLVNVVAATSSVRTAELRIGKNALSRTRKNNRDCNGWDCPPHADAPLKNVKHPNYQFVIYPRIRFRQRKTKDFPKHSIIFSFSCNISGFETIAH